MTRTSISELMRLPKLNDTELLDELSHDIYSIPSTRIHRRSAEIFDPNVDEQIIYHANFEEEWADLMVAGPISINYMSIVLAVASKRDFGLKSNFTYRYIKYPDSFHTTLVQVTHDMHKALYGAHTNMEKIQANMRQMPTLLKTALKLITQASTSMMKAMLPRTLTNIARYANDSAAVAQESLGLFENLFELLKEIVLVSTLTNKDNRDLAEKMANESKQLETKKVADNAALERIKVEYETARKDLETARVDYHKAMANVPSSQWDVSAWIVYANYRPVLFCYRHIWWRSCRWQREEPFYTYTREAKEKAQNALKLLQEAERNSKALYDQLMHKQDEMSASMNKLAAINFNELSITETIKILIDATQQIANVQKQWTRITRFFSTLAVQTERTQKVILENFLGSISDVQSASTSLTELDKVLFTTLLVESATDVDRDSHLLFVMAKTYNDVSSEYMLDQIASISGFLMLQTDAERNVYARQINENSMKTVQAVQKLATERKRMYELMNYNRQEQYLQFIEDANLNEVKTF